MSNSAVEVANLLYRYAELVDSGDLSGVGSLLENARMKILGSDEVQDSAVTMAAIMTDSSASTANGGLPTAITRCLT